MIRENRTIATNKHSSSRKLCIWTARQRACACTSCWSLYMRLNGSVADAIGNLSLLLEHWYERAHIHTLAHSLMHRHRHSHRHTNWHVSMRSRCDSSVCLAYWGEWQNRGIHTEKWECLLYISHIILRMCMIKYGTHTKHTVQLCANRVDALAIAGIEYNDWRQLSQVDQCKREREPDTMLSPRHWLRLLHCAIVHELSINTPSDLCTRSFIKKKWASTQYYNSAHCRGYAIYLLRTGKGGYVPNKPYGRGHHYNYTIYVFIYEWTYRRICRQQTESECWRCD